MLKVNKAILLVFIGTFSHNIVSAQELTLADIFERVENQNLQVLLNCEKVCEALAQTYIERADLLPEVIGESSQSRSLNLANFGGAAFPFHTNRFDADFAGSFSVIDMRKWADYCSARKGHAVSVMNYEALLEDVLNEAGKMYFTHLRNLKRMEVIDATIEQDTVLLDIAQTKLNAGAASALDVTRAQVQLARDKKIRLQQQTEVRTSELNLKRILNEVCSGPVLLRELNPKNRGAPEDYRRDICQALDCRSDYIAAERQYDRDQYNYNTAYWDYIPKLETSGKWGVASMKAFDGKENQEWALQVGVSMPLFDGMRIASNKRQLRAKMRGQCAALLDLENAIRTELAINAQDMQSRFDQVELSRTEVELSTTELDFAQTRFVSGVADNSDVIDAQTNLARARDELVDAVYRYDLSRLEWARAMGDVKCILKDEQ